MQTNIISADWQLGKIINFIIFCNESKFQAAQLILSSIKNQTYVKHMKYLIKRLSQEQLVKAKLNINRQINKIYFQDIAVLNKEKVRSDFIVDKQQAYSKIILSYLEKKQYKLCLKLTQQIGNPKLQNIVQQLIDFQDLKNKISNQYEITQNDKKNDALQRLKQLIRMRQSISSQLAQNLHNYNTLGQIPELSSSLFTESCKKQFEILFTYIRQLKNNQISHNKQFESKLQQICHDVVYDRQLGAGRSKIQYFLDQIKKRLFRSQKLAKRNHSNINNSDFQSGQNDGQQNNGGKKFKRRKDNSLVHSLNFEKLLQSPSKIEIKKQNSFNIKLIQQINNLLQQSFLVKFDKNIYQQMDIWLQKLFSILKTICEQYQQIKNQCQTLDKAIKQKRIAQTSIQANAFNDHNTAKQLQLLQKIQNLEKQIKRRKQIQQSHIRKIRQLQQSKLYTMFSHQDNSQKHIFDERQSSLLKDNLLKLQREKQAAIHQLIETKSKYQKQLASEIAKSTNLGEKCRKLNEEIYQQIEQIAYLNNIYEERFLLQSEAYREENIQASRVKMSPAQQTKKVQTHQYGAGESVVDEPNIFPNPLENESFLGSMRQQLSFVNLFLEDQFTKIAELQRTIDIMKNQFDRKQFSLQSELQNAQKKMVQLERNVKQLQKLNYGLQSKLNTIQIQKITHSSDNVKYLHLFPPGFIFAEQDYRERLFLLETLTKRVGRIKATPLLFRADHFNKSNFHKYIDGIANIVVIFKTILGKLIAGYSSAAFDPKGIKSGDGMIISLWNKKVFTFKQKKAIIYDDYYLIFGNAELRVRSQQFKLFSNFGINNSYYYNYGQKVGSLLGEGQQNEVHLAEYEIYSLQLADE